VASLLEPRTELNAPSPTNGRPRGITLNKDGTGGYVPDAFEILHPSGNAPYTQVSAVFNRDLGRAVVMWSQTTAAFPGGWMLDGWGGI
jgi:hypothetical protein